MRTQDEIMYALLRSKKYKWTLKEIAELFGCDVATVRRHIDKERWEKWEIVISPKKLQEIYNKLGTVRKVADALMCSTGVIVKKMDHYGIKRNPCGRRKCSR
jgi:predicted transcriptional regulator